MVFRASLHSMTLRHWGVVFGYSMKTYNVPGSGLYQAWGPWEKKAVWQTQVLRSLRLEEMTNWRCVVPRVYTW